MKLTRMIFGSGRRQLRRRRKVGKVAMIAYLFIGSSVADAACLQSDIAGTWFMSGLQLQTAEFYDTHLFCKIVFSEEGFVSTSTSVCYDKYGIATYFVGGKFNVYEGCNTQGYVDTRDAGEAVTFRTHLGGMVSADGNAWSGAGVTVGFSTVSSVQLNGFRQ
jgi:hypothetical protein